MDTKAATIAKEQALDSMLRAAVNLLQVWVDLNQSQYSNDLAPADVRSILEMIDTLKCDFICDYEEE
tara:strand:+ start:935 stop:1135 length:201 start_codon:yes stop_codon:yes gene_type:complete